jgi:hypothetical protein
MGEVPPRAHAARGLNSEPQLDISGPGDPPRAETIVGFRVRATFQEFAKISVDPGELNRIAVKSTPRPVAARYPQKTALP